MSIEEQVKELSREVLEQKFIRLHIMASNCQKQLEAKEETINITQDEIDLFFLKLKRSDKTNEEKKQLRQTILLLKNNNDNLLYKYIKKTIPQ